MYIFIYVFVVYLCLRILYTVFLYISVYIRLCFIQKTKHIDLSINSCIECKCECVWTCVCVSVHMRELNATSAILANIHIKYTHMQRVCFCVFGCL